MSNRSCLYQLLCVCVCVGGGEGGGGGIAYSNHESLGMNILCVHWEFGYDYRGATRVLSTGGGGGIPPQTLQLPPPQSEGV